MCSLRNRRITSVHGKKEHNQKISGRRGQSIVIHTFWNSPVNKPRDHNAAATIGWIRVARRFSNVISPPVIFAVLALVLSLEELALWPGFLWAAVFGFLVSLAPIIVVVYLLQTGRISDLHMNTSEERRLPYITGVIGAILALLIIVIFDGPYLLRSLAVLSVIELSALSIITNYWMISIHSTSISAATVVVGLVYGFVPALFLIPLIALVSWVRLYLRRHSPNQVVLGILIGLVSVITVRLIGYF